jgi:hypothetical protein
VRRLVNGIHEDTGKLLSVAEVVYSWPALMPICLHEVARVSPIPGVAPTPTRTWRHTVAQYVLYYMPNETTMSQFYNTNSKLDAGANQSYAKSRKVAQPLSKKWATKALLKSHLQGLIECGPLCRGTARSLHEIMNMIKRLNVGVRCAATRKRDWTTTGLICLRRIGVISKKKGSNSEMLLAAMLFV